MTDEGLLHLTASAVYSLQAPDCAASHLFTDPPQLCDQSMQSFIQTRHAQQGIAVSFPNHL